MARPMLLSLLTCVFLGCCFANLPRLSRELDQATALGSGPNSVETNVTFDQFARRWYSIATPDRQGPYMTTWPVDGCGFHSIRFCFDTQDTARNYGHIFAAAIAKWAPAMQHSSLRIVPDPTQCQGVFRCVCNDQMPPDTLRFIYHPTNHVESSLGYYPNSDERWRHFITYHPYTPLASNEDAWNEIMLLAHELGHTIGLTHEFQRHDRDDYVTFQYWNLNGYDEVLSRIASVNEPRWPPATSQAARMSMVCSNLALAASHFPSCSWGVKWTGPHGLDPVGMQSGGPFDYSSMMNYYSHLDCKHVPCNTPAKWTLRRKGSDEPIWTGGAPADLAVPSGWDVGRVVTLYPPIQPPGQNVQDQGQRRHLNKSNRSNEINKASDASDAAAVVTFVDWKAVRVTIYDMVTTTIKPITEPVTTFGPEFSSWTALSGGLDSIKTYGIAKGS